MYVAVSLLAKAHCTLLHDCLLVRRYVLVFQASGSSEIIETSKLSTSATTKLTSSVSCLHFCVRDTVGILSPSGEIGFFFPFMGTYRLHLTYVHILVPSRCMGLIRSADKMVFRGIGFPTSPIQMLNFFPWQCVCKLSLLN